MNSQIRRIGTLGPPGNTALEREIPPSLPPGVLMNHNRLSRPGSGINSDSLLAMAQSTERAATDLAQAYPEIILYGCTSGSFLAGLGNEANIAQSIAGITGIPSITTSTAVINALRAVSAKRVFMLTPYPKDITLHEVEFLDHYGIETVHWDTFECPTSEAIRQKSSTDVHDRVLANQSHLKDCDAVFISCTNLLSMDRISALEQAVGKPVVSSNQASMWAMLRFLGVNTRYRPDHLFQTNGTVDVSLPGSSLVKSA